MQRQGAKNRRENLNAFRDQNPRNEWPEMPVETPYLTSCRKRAVCGDNRALHLRLAGVDLYVMRSTDKNDNDKTGPIASFARS
jgi:hypothetical protein